ncbi:unnamed protein product [Protopolystoma xenopodis]|uniref:Uncharacterized protein n=1 Tax=Protopolystoma xenopodis TaxID=117903 RepID=A0A3S4ZU02_9PLAT|nr:unnamed protein product [Protopolystoma xenopodis]
MFCRSATCLPSLAGPSPSPVSTSEPDKRAPTRVPFPDSDLSPSGTIVDWVNRHVFCQAAIRRPVHVDCKSVSSHNDTQTGVRGYRASEILVVRVTEGFKVRDKIVCRLYLLLCAGRVLGHINGTYARIAWLM